MQKFLRKKYVFLALAAILVFATGISAAVYLRNQKIREQQLIAEMMEHQRISPPAKPEYIYGLRVDQFEVEERQIEKGDFFADMLAPFNIPFNTIFDLSVSARPFFNTRQFAHGKPYTVVYERGDTASYLKYLIYEQNPVDYVIFDFRDSARVYSGKKEMKVVRRLASGMVHSSLFESMTESNLSPQTAVELAEIFASTIDFYRIRKGDFYKIIFEEKIVEGKSVGIEKILAAQFNHDGQDNYAFRFEQDSKFSYFDEQGNSQRKAFLKSPLKFGRLSSGFTMRRFHPVQKRYKAHLGTDYAAPKGTPILAIGDGVILEAKYGAFNGNYVKIRHSSNITTQYLHMSRFAKGIRPGAKVMQGEVIGYVGSTGLSTGPHVCFRYWKNGVQVNHLREKFATYTPVNIRNRAAFEQLRDALMDELNGINLPKAPEEMKLEAGVGHF
jgi:murein DD-endopeptidase MepM/ murein hydrolase activator NlpD